MQACLCNGAPVDHLAVEDRGLQYGDGVFRTLRVVNGSPQGWQTHLQRLQHDCERLYLSVPDAAVLAREVAQLFADGGDGVLKIVITRGSSGRGYAPAAEHEATRLLLRYLLARRPALTPAGVTIDVCKLRLGRNPALAGVKHLNRLEQVLAQRECRLAGHAEGLILDSEDWVISGTMSNLFVIRNKRLETPALTHAGVLGATRQRLFAAAEAAGHAPIERQLRLDDCLAADELFLCNSVMGVCPVRALAGRRFAVGPLTRWAQAQVAA